MCIFQFILQIPRLIEKCEKYQQQQQRDTTKTNNEQCVWDSISAHERVLPGQHGLLRAQLCRLLSSCVEVLIPSTSECERIFEIKVFKQVIKVK